MSRVSVFFFVILSETEHTRAIVSSEQIKIGCDGGGKNKKIICRNDTHLSHEREPFI